MSDSEIGFDDDFLATLALMGATEGALEPAILSLPSDDGYQAAAAAEAETAAVLQATAELEAAGAAAEAGRLRIEAEIDAKAKLEAAALAEKLAEAEARAREAARRREDEMAQEGLNRARQQEVEEEERKKERLRIQQEEEALEAEELRRIQDRTTVERMRLLRETNPPADLSSSSSSSSSSSLPTTPADDPPAPATVPPPMPPRRAAAVPPPSSAASAPAPISDSPSSLTTPSISPARILASPEQAASGPQAVLPSLPPRLPARQTTNRSFEALPGVAPQHVTTPVSPADQQEQPLSHPHPHQAPSVHPKLPRAAPPPRPPKSTPPTLLPDGPSAAAAADDHFAEMPLRPQRQPTVGVMMMIPIDPVRPPRASAPAPNPPVVPEAPPIPESILAAPFQEGEADGSSQHPEHVDEPSRGSKLTTSGSFKDRREIFKHAHLVTISQDDLQSFADAPEAPYGLAPIGLLPTTQAPAPPPPQRLFKPSDYYIDPVAMQASNSQQAQHSQQNQVSPRASMPPDASIDNRSILERKAEIMTRLTHWIPQRTKTLRTAPKWLGKVVAKSTKVPVNVSIFGLPLEQVCEEAGISVPLVVTDCISFLDPKHMDSEGLFRKSGSVRALLELRDRYTDPRVSIVLQAEIMDEHIVAGLMKRFFSELPTSILPGHFYDALLQLSALSDPLEAAKRIRAEVIDQLRPCYRQTLSVLLQFLARLISHSEQNFMNVSNIAIVWAPNVLKSADQGIQDLHTISKTSHQAMSFLITHHDQIFEPLTVSSSTELVSPRPHLIPPSSSSSSLSTTTTTTTPTTGPKSMPTPPSFTGPQPSPYGPPVISPRLESPPSDSPVNPSRSPRTAPEPSFPIDRADTTSPRPTDPSFASSASSTDPPPAPDSDSTVPSPAAPSPYPATYSSPSAEDLSPSSPILETAPSASSGPAAAAAAGEPGEVIRTGWLIKRGRIRKNWKKRWFILKRDGTLSYHPSDVAIKSVLGSVDLKALQHVELAAPNSSRTAPTTFQLRFPGRVLWLTADSIGSTTNWMDELKKFLNLNHLK